VKGLFDSPGGRKVLFALLYLSEGAPMGYLWWALPTKLQLAGLEIDEITALTSALALPWAFKFLWAPAVDGLRSKSWSFRAWIVSAQIGMGLTLLPLFASDFRDDFAWIYPLLLAHAFLASLQDVAIDGLAITVTPPEERGALNGWMQTGLLAGRALFGGGILLVETHLGERGALALLIGAIWLALTVVLLGGRPPGTADERAFGQRLRGLAASLRKALARRRTWLAMLFAASAGMAFEAVGQVAGPFLETHGYSKEDIGWFYLPVALLTSAGAILGGYLSDRLGRRRAAAIAVAVVAALVLALAGVDYFLDQLEPNAAPAAGRQDDASGARYYLLTALFLAIGFFTSATYALFMDLTVPGVAATQFAVFMGMTNLCESWSTRVVGALAGDRGYPAAFTIMALASLLTLPLLAGLRVTPPGETPPGETPPGETPESPGTATGR
jgi:MFS family permease